ncbi:hypothetical protein, partial [Paenirhodobacter enshiensis]|uniref:hypothetical protein n=1 Tax=Paenirhodobacter enshiensis TaxID=1105367 RepID=UPI003FA240E2
MTSPTFDAIRSGRLARAGVLADPGAAAAQVGEIASRPLEARPDEVIHSVGARRNHRLDRWRVGPVVFVFRAVGDPGSQQVLLRP